MWARLKATIKHSRSQSKKQTIARRRLKGQLKARDEKIARLNAELTHLRKLTEPGKVFNHVYPAQISDCTHVMMNAVKDLFGQDEALSKLSASIGQLRSRFMLTDWGYLLPPALRDKDRFLRVLTIVQWAGRMDDYWAKGPVKNKFPVSDELFFCQTRREEEASLRTRPTSNEAWRKKSRIKSGSYFSTVPKLPAKARQHIAFYRKAWPLIRRLRQVRELIVVASSILKTAGLSEYSHQRWRKRADQYLDTQKVVTKQARVFIKRIDDYFASHATLYQKQSQLLCCSDIIESTFKGSVAN